MTTTDRPQGNRNFNRRQRSKFFVRRRLCQFCVDKVDSIDYKDIPLLQRYMSEGSKIDSRRKSGVCAKHQRTLATAIKRARHVGMVPFDRSHKFVIKQTYQRGPDQRGYGARTNEDKTTSTDSETNQGLAKENKTAAPSAESDQTTEATTTDKETAAAAEPDKKE